MASSRTSTRVLRSLPSASKAPASKTRKSLPWSPKGNSSTLSKRSVPPLAKRRRPGRSRSVLAWPRSSASSAAAGTAVQCRVTKGWSERGLQRWSARASRSLPVPVSPWMRTGARRLGHLAPQGQHPLHGGALGGLPARGVAGQLLLEKLGVDMVLPV